MKIECTAEELRTLVCGEKTVSDVIMDPDSIKAKINTLGIKIKEELSR